MFRKLHVWAVAAGMISSLFTIIPTQVQAKLVTDLYPMSCNAFEVDSVGANSGGSITFTMTKCTSDWNEAKQAMYALGDAGVIRHSSSWSPTKIINMSSGIAISYPKRDNSNTLTINQYYDFYSGSEPYDNKTMAITYQREMQFNGLYSWNGDGSGLVLVTVSGFTGYAQLRDVDLVPMVVLSHGWGMYLGGSDSEKYPQDPYGLWPKQQYYRVERNGNYTDLVLHYFYEYGRDGNATEYTAAVGPAAEWMSIGDVYYSYDNYTFYRDRYCTDQAGIYYSYYQFLFLRSRTNISASTFNTFLASRGYNSSSKLWNTGDIWLKAQETYGVNAAEIFALACLESGYGTSDYAMKRNNLFGWNAVDSDPDQASFFSSVEDSINQMMGINIRSFIDIHDWRYFGSQLGNKGSGLNVKYATDNLWGVKIASIAYALDKCNNNNDGTLTDFNTVSLGIVNNDTRTYILKSPGGDRLYFTWYGPTYQMNHTLSILAEVNGWYKVQSTNPLDGSGNVISFSNGANQNYYSYNFDTMVGWIRKDEVTLINSAPISNAGMEATGDPVRTLDALSWNENGTLHLSGKNYVPGVWVTGDNTVSQTLHLVNFAFTDVQQQNLTLSSSTDAIGWSTDLDVSSLTNGSYFFRIDGSYSLTTDYSSSWYVPSVDSAPASVMRNGHSYSFTAASVNGSTVLVLSVSDVDCGANAKYDADSNACVCFENYSDWTAGSGCNYTPSSPAEEDVTLMKSVESIGFSGDDDTKLSVSGYAFLSGMDAVDGTKISATVSLEPLAGGDDIAVTTATMSGNDEPVPLGDGHTYQWINYAADLDLSSLTADELGTYSLKITVTNGDTSRSGYLYLNLNTAKQTEFEGGTVDLGDETQGSLYLSSNPVYLGRLELDFARGSIDRSVISKKVRNSSRSGGTLSIDENGVLSIPDGYGLLAETSMTAANKPAFAIDFLNADTGEVVSGTDLGKVSPKACDVDLGTLLGSSYSATDACYAAELDLAGKDTDGKYVLSEGTYVLYLDVSSTEDGTTYRDVYEMYNVMPVRPVKVTVGDRTYTLRKGSVHNRYELTIASNDEASAASSSSADGKN